MIGLVDPSSLCVSAPLRAAIFKAISKHRVVPGQSVQVVDTIGSGDAFSAAFLSDYLRHGDPLAAVWCFLCLPLSDLKLQRLFVVHAGTHSFDLAKKIRALALTDLLDELKPWQGSCDGAGDHRRSLLRLGPVRIREGKEHHVGISFQKA